MTIGIYCIENLINSKKYIGQSINLESRMNSSHKDSVVLTKAIKKHGSINFKRWVIEYCLPEELDSKEIFYIKKLNSHVTQNGYNVSWGGNSPMRNRKTSKKIRKKISENNAKYWTGKERTQETKDKIRNTKLGTKASKKTKKTFSKIHLGRKQSNGLSSIYVGTYKRNDNGKYRSSIKFRGIIYRTGSFETEEEAARAYDVLYKKLNKTSNAPNFPNQ